MVYGVFYLKGICFFDCCGMIVGFFFCFVFFIGIVVFGFCLFFIIKNFGLVWESVGNNRKEGVYVVVVFVFFLVNGV